MNVTFLIRKRQLPGTALHNAARYDRDFIGSRHTARILAVPEGDMLNTNDLYQTDLVVIEGAGWVAPFDIARIADMSEVIVRVHAAPEFLYYEFPGTCITEYIAAAREAGARIACVSEALANILGTEWLPIVYPVGEGFGMPRKEYKLRDVGCFGAIRPLKNHTGQLLALSAYRRSVFVGPDGIRMHINSTRVEGCGHILAELKALAKKLEITLVCHDWADTDTFKRDVIPSMDLGLFGSYAESFCLTAADFVAAGVPCVLSRHIPWAGYPCATDIDSMTNAIGCARWYRLKNWEALKAHSEKAGVMWHQAIGKV